MKPAFDISILQKILDEQGYLVIGSRKARHIGDVLQHICTPDHEPYAHPAQTVVVGLTNETEFQRQAERYDFPYSLMRSKGYIYFVRVISE